MFEVYAAQIEYRHTVAERDRGLRLNALRRARTEHEPARRARRRPALVWPRPIVLPGARLAAPAS